MTFASMNKRKFIMRSLLFATLAGLLAITSGVLSVKAQTVGQWALDQKVAGYLDDTFTPFLVADQNRTVHAFASQWVGPEGDRQLAIVYRQWSLTGGWTKPVDILLSPNGDARIQSAFIDASGMIHLIFWGGDSKNANIYYSHAPVTSADLSAAWSEPVIVGEKALEPMSASLAGDEQGHLVIIYTGSTEGAGVYEVHSIDSGRDWSKARPIFLTLNPTLFPYSVRLYMGKSGLLHATWNVVTNLGVDVSVHYARYDVTHDQWTDPISLNQRVGTQDAFGPSFPMIVGNGKDIIIMYNNGNPFSGRPVPAGRPVQMVSISSDDGLNWQAPEVPFYQLLGRSGEHALVVDSDQAAHALFVQRIESVRDGKYKVLGGIWHSIYQNGVWSNPDVLNTSIAPHDVRAVICQGNVLLVVWREDPGEGNDGVWYSYTVLDSPELPVVQPPTQAPVHVATETAVLNAGLVPTTATPMETLTVNKVNAPSSFARNPAGSLIITTLFVFIILVVIVFAYNRRGSRSK